MRTVPTIAFALLLCGASGCVFDDAPFDEERQTEAPREAAVQPIELTPAQQRVLVAARASLALRSMEASAKLKAVDPGNDFSLRCSVRLLAARPDRLRMFATKGLGTEILDLAMVGDSIDVWLPRDAKLLRGHTAELEDVGVAFHPRDILDHLLLSEAFPRLEWTVTEESEETVTLEGAGTVDAFERLVLSAEDGRMLSRALVRRGDDAPALLVTYDAYRPVLEEAPDLRFPHRLRIRFPGDDREVLFVITSLLANPRVRAGDFRLMVTSDATVEPLVPEDAEARDRQWRQALESAAEASE